MVVLNGNLLTDWAAFRKKQLSRFLLSRPLSFCMEYFPDSGKKREGTYNFVGFLGRGFLDLKK